MKMMVVHECNWRESGMMVVNDRPPASWFRAGEVKDHEKRGK
jgi:hypothetical protein